MSLSLKSQSMAPVESQYQTITDFANWFATTTKINEISDLELLLKKFGADIKYITMGEWQSNKFNFLEIDGVQKIKLHICQEFEPNLKKVFFTQALGHYVLHAEEGKRRFVLKNLSDKTAQNQEGLCFSLGVLLPDAAFLPIVSLDNEELARLFRVPKEIVAIKKTFLKKEKLIK